MRRAPWGVKVLRYEIKNINPPKDVLQAMEKQMRAEREKRAVVLTSEGDRDAKINQAEGEKQRVIKESEANKQQQINEAQGQAEAILAVATATAEGLKRVGEALAGAGGVEAMQLRVAEEYVKQFGKLADEASSTLIVPANLSDISSMIAMATSGEAAEQGRGLIGSSSSTFQTTGMVTDPHRRAPGRSCPASLSRRDLDDCVAARAPTALCRGVCLRRPSFSPCVPDSASALRRRARGLVRALSRTR